MKWMLSVLLSALVVGGDEALAQTVPDLAVSPFPGIQAKQFQHEWADYLQSKVTVSNSIGMRLCLIPPGEFQMGSPVSERGRGDGEIQHRVKIKQAFYLGAHEVTQEQYERVMGENPSHFSPSGDSKDRVLDVDTAQLPVENVSAHEMLEFCRRLSEVEGVDYRLPTEAEWEYACRSGTNTIYHTGSKVSELKATGWFADNSGKAEMDSRSVWKLGQEHYYQQLLVNGCRPHAVGRKTSNAWGLYDMHGNVWEWCQTGQESYGDTRQRRDRSTAPPNGQVLRGGGFRGLPLAVRSAFRYPIQPGARGDDIGFRLARTCDQDSQ